MGRTWVVREFNANTDKLPDCSSVEPGDYDHTGDSDNYDENDNKAGAE